MMFHHYFYTKTKTSSALIESVFVSHWWNVPHEVLGPVYMYIYFYKHIILSIHFLIAFATLIHWKNTAFWNISISKKYSFEVAKTLFMGKQCQVHEKMPVYKNI